MMNPATERAVKTLLSGYWSTAGWREERTVRPADLRQAVQAGVMFEGTVTMAHDDIVSGVIEAVALLSAQEVAEAFVASLSTRQMYLRSALGSYVVASHLAPHRFEPMSSRADSRRCAVCGLCDVEKEIDQNVLNFERYKWGGVRRDHLDYVWLDLKQFVDAERPPASREARRALEKLLGELETAPPGTTAPKAARDLLRGIKANRAERAVLLDILGVCSILVTPEHRGYLDKFVRAEDRVLPPLRFVEQAYPVCWWKSEAGVNRRAATTLGLL